MEQNVVFLGNCTVLNFNHLEPKQKQVEVAMELGLDACWLIDALGINGVFIFMLSSGVTGRRNIESNCFKPSQFQLGSNCTVRDKFYGRNSPGLNWFKPRGLIGHNMV
jgi:hypothetical protein